MKKIPVLDNAIEDITFQSLHDLIVPIYLDNNATTRVDETAVIAMMHAMENDYGNPSALHKYGRQAQTIIDMARKDIAEFIGCKPDQFIFVSSGTEAINAVIDTIKHNYTKRTIITCLTEHNATLNKLKTETSFNVYYLSVDEHGYFDLQELEKYLKINSESNALVSLMAVNNETGTIHKNMFEAIELSHKYNALFHIDAVQAAGKIPLQPYIEYGTDYLSISAHKFHGPKGIGALYIHPKASFYPIFFGGSQEYGFRAGTENVPGILGMAAVTKNKPVFDKSIEKLHNLFIELLMQEIPSCRINGGGLPGTINVGFKYIHRDAMVLKLSENNVYAAVGSACAHGVEPSHVLKAMNVPSEYIHGSVRFSFSKYTTEYEIKKAIHAIKKSYDELRSISIGLIS